jgi:hypothetical protein
VLPALYWTAPLQIYSTAVYTEILSSVNTVVRQVEIETGPVQKVLLRYYGNTSVVNKVFQKLGNL